MRFFEKGLVHNNTTNVKCLIRCSSNVSILNYTYIVFINYKLQMLFKKCFVILYGNIDLFALIRTFSLLI